MDKITTLLRLKALLDEGILTEEEFNKEKQRILGEGTVDQQKDKDYSVERTPLSDGSDSPSEEKEEEIIEQIYQDTDTGDDNRPKWKNIAIIGAVALTAIIIALIDIKPFSKRHSSPGATNTAQKTATVTQPRSSTTNTPKSIFTVVYANSSDGFVNVRSEPSNSGRIVAELYNMFGGLGDGILLEKGDSWSKVSVNGTVGWCYNKYLGFQTWYSGHGNNTLVAKKDSTPIYRDDLSGEGRYSVFARVDKGTIIADDYEEDGQFYYLLTADEGLLVMKSDVQLR